MADFVDDYTDPPETKVDATAVAAGASTTKYIRATDINKLSDSTVSLRTAILGYKYDRRFNVLRYGATGNGVTDDLTAINSAYAAAKAAGGGVVFFPRPSVCYRVTGRILFGQHFLGEQDIKYVLGNAWDPRAQASYSSSGETAALSEVVVSIEADPGTEIWGDFAPGTETAILYYGIKGGDVVGSSSAHISNITFVGQAGYSNSAPVFPSGSTPTTSNLVGVCLAGSRVKLQGVTVRECRRGIVGFDCEWSKFEKVQVKHAIVGYEVLSHNAGRIEQCVAEYCSTYGLIAAGQGVRIRGFDTEQCAVDIWVPNADQISIDGGYLETTDATHTGYSIVWGDTTVATANQVIWAFIKNVHGTRPNGRHMLLHSADVLAHNTRLYSTNVNSLTRLNNIYAKLLTDERSGLPIDPTSVVTGGSRRSSPVVDGATATAFDWDTNNTLSTAGSKLWRVANNASEKFSIARDGSVVASGTVTSAGLVTTGAAFIGAINTASAAVLPILSQVADGASAIAVSLGSDALLSNSTAKLLSVRNNMGTSGVNLERLAVDINGKILFAGYTDSSGTPGNATANTVTGRSAIAAAGTAATITNSTVTATSIVDVVLEDLDTTATRVKVVPAAGSFTVTANAAATAATKFRWKVTN